MGVSAAMRDKLHRAYWEFFETAERKRRWSVFDDIPWDEIDEQQDDPAKALPSKRDIELLSLVK